MRGIDRGRAAARLSSAVTVVAAHGCSEPRGAQARGRALTVATHLGDNAARADVAAAPAVLLVVHDVDAPRAAAPLVAAIVLAAADAIRAGDHDRALAAADH